MLNKGLGQLVSIHKLIKLNIATMKSSVQKSDFKILKVIGRGSYGKVYLVEHEMTGQLRAKTE